jgi:ATP-dependent Clp protease ATP-binding subunit ClpA
MFQPLDIESVKNICNIQILKVTKLLEGRGISITVTPEADRYLCLIGRVYVFYVGHVDKSSLNPFPL